MSAHRDSILAHLRESCRVKQSFSDELLERIERFAVRSADALAHGGKIVFFGNGGSAADAQHLAAELVVKLCAERPSLAALALTTDTSILTAAGNDFGFERIFERQIESLVNAADLVVALSTSGNSANVIRGLDAAEKKGAYRVGLTGQSGGKLSAHVDLLINIPSSDPQHIQESHITVGHIACMLIEQMRMGRSAR
jgi:D-sedoheptulose 7-phosphate isomerase